MDMLHSLPLPAKAPAPVRSASGAPGRSQQDSRVEESGALSEALAKDPGWSPLVALGLIVFTMFYSPCFVSVVCISRESGSWKWGAFSIAFNTLLAFGLAVLIYQVGSALGA